MKKAVIATGGKQYLVAEGETLAIEKIAGKAGDKVSFDALLVIDDGKVQVGMPLVKGIKVGAEITVEDQKTDKVTAIRYKAKKRVHKVRGHRQTQTIIKIASVA
jgi:large subunit ribosomal protein L21